MKRIGLFLLTNLAVMAVLGVVLTILYSVFGVSSVDGAGGIDFGGLMIISAVVGFGGSLISLAMSKFMAMRMTGAKVIKDPRTELEMWLVSTVKRQADAAGIGMPDVAIYDAPDVNAFATGARRNSALVAVSTGLLRNMSRDEAEAVLGHEIAHVANGDMVTLTLIQGVVNTFVVFLAHVIGRFVDKAVFKTENGHGPGFFIAYFVAQMVLGILASVIVMWFSRQREFRADQGGAQLAGKQKMIAALERLKAGTQPAQLPDEMKAMGINGGRSQLARLFMTHPPLEERIEALRRSA